MTPAEEITKAAQTIEYCGTCEKWGDHRAETCKWLRTGKVRVRCLGCGWRGIRSVPECECYDYVCRPGGGGVGCPRKAVTARCPNKCVSRLSGWAYSAVVVTGPVRTRRALNGGGDG